MISVAGRVGAGDEVDLIDAYAKGGGMYFIACLPQIEPHGVFAVEVQGDSMASVYQPGSVLLHSRDVMGVPAESLNHTCICEDTDRKGWVKHVKPGTEPGLFHLLSTNPAGLNMQDIALRWAAPSVCTCLPISSRSCRHHERQRSAQSCRTCLPQHDAGHQREGREAVIRCGRTCACLQL